jgi:phage FluMu protein Com
VDAKKVKCAKCYRLLCKRVPVHLDKDESYIVHIIHSKMEIFAYDVTIKCPACGSTHRVNGDEGLLGKETT